ncbi:hypothetical protein G6F24_015716 [Rhizopus arrhizus]|nr:hypothetical protein G6F24_015716 [Rhizopus arrhizus]
MGFSRASLKAWVAAWVSGTVRLSPFFVSRSFTTRFLTSTWCLRSEVISEERMPVSTAILTIHPSIGLW